MATPKRSGPNVYRVSIPTSTEDLQFLEWLEYAFSDVKGQEQQHMCSGGFKFPLTEQ